MLIDVIYVVCQSTSLENLLWYDAKVWYQREAEVFALGFSACGAFSIIDIVWIF